MKFRNRFSHTTKNFGIEKPFDYIRYTAYRGNFYYDAKMRFRDIHVICNNTTNTTFKCAMESNLMIAGKINVLLNSNA